MTNEELCIEALRRIAFGHMSLKQQKKRNGLVGHTYLECLEMAYEDIQNIAKRALKGELRNPLAEIMFSKEDFIANE